MHRVFDWSEGPRPATRASPGPRLHTWEFGDDFTPAGRAADVADGGPARDGESVCGARADPS